MKGRFTGRVVVAVLVVFAVLCALLSRVLLPMLDERPPEPTFDGKPLSVWFRERRYPAFDRKRFKELMDTEGEKSVPWLLWAAQHGDRQKTSAFGKFVDKFLLGQDPDYDERGTAMDTLCSMKTEHLRNANRQDFEKLKSLVPEEGGAPAAYILARLGGASYDWILQTAATGSDVARWHTVGAFGAAFESGTEEEQLRAIEALLVALEDTDFRVRASAINCCNEFQRHGLMQASIERVASVLKKLRSDPNPHVSGAATESLIILGRHGK